MNEHPQSNILPPTKTCPICHGLGRHLIGTFHACACGVVFQDYANIDQSVYDGGYHRKYVSAAAEAAYRRATDLYLSAIERLTPGRWMLEIGSVVNVTLKSFQEAGWDVVGCDINEHSCVCSDGAAIPYVVGDFEDAAIGGAFDCIWASHVFEHFRDPMSGLRKAARLLSEDGVIFLAMPDAGQLNFERPTTWGHLHVKEHHIMFTLARFLDVAWSIGLIPAAMRVNTCREDGFISWSDFHVLLVRSERVDAVLSPEFPSLASPPPRPSLTFGEWHGQPYAILPYDLMEGPFWAMEAKRRGLEIPTGMGGFRIELKSARVEPFPFYCEPSATAAFASGGACGDRAVEAVHAGSNHA